MIHRISLNTQNCTDNIVFYTIGFFLVPNIVFARLPYQEGYYDGLSGGTWEHFIPAILVFLFTGILGRRDMIKNGKSFDSDTMEVGGFFGKWFLILMLGFVFSIITFGGLIEIISVVSVIALIGFSKTRS
jgi:hypothetical protein